MAQHNGIPVSLKFGSEVLSEVRGKLFLRISKAFWMAFGTFCWAGMAANLVVSASRALSLCLKIDLRYVKAFVRVSNGTTPAVDAFFSNKRGAER
jgi:hypothetical protein